MTLIHVHDHETKASLFFFWGGGRGEELSFRRVDSFVALLVFSLVVTVTSPPVMTVI